jgi:3-phosphoshikimate 1-carboxyvinyltransferase
MNYSVKCIYNRTTDKNISVTVPGSKSITARALLISAIAEGKSTLYGAQLSDDCATFLNCLKSLGIECEIHGTTITVNGCGGKLSVQNAEINVGSAGTAARFIPAFLAFQKGEFKVTCSEQMKRRPIAPLINTLREVGATFEFLENDNSFPFIIRGTDKPNGSVSVDIGESSQFLSALLISAVCAKKGLEIKVFGSHGLDYVNMTLDMMWSFGVTVDEREDSYFVSGAYSAKKYDIEPDLSAACYFYAMNRILGTNISVKGVMPHSMQGDSKFIELIKTFDGGKVDMSSFSDQTLTLSAIAPFFSKPTQIVGVAHIRRQECDRIKAIVENLTALGVKCEELEDGVIIYPATPHGGNITTFGDHRVAMSFAITGLRVEGVVILNAEVCSKTFKNYFEVLDEICEKIAE